MKPLNVGRRKHELIRSLAAAVVFAALCTGASAQIAADKCKFLGNVIAGSVPSDFLTYWNQVTPENSGKWGSVEATRDVMNWAQLDLAYNFAKNNGLPFKQHTFVWGQQQPAWVATLMQDTSIPVEQRYAEVRGEVEEWIQQYCERYPQTDYIDVVNEPFHATPSYDLALGSGWNWVVWAFQKARQYCPNAKLILNDYNIINIDAATNDYVGLINILKEQSLIDAIGVQGHRFEVESTPVETLENNLDKLGATGLPIYITEFDVGNINNTSSGNPATDDNEQLQIYQRVFPVLWDHPSVHGITIWGYLEGTTWQSTAYLVRNNGTARPALNWLRGYVENHNGGFFCGDVTSNEDDPKLTPDIWPNPTDGAITIRAPYIRTEVAITDINGRVQRKFSMSNDPVQVKLQNAGVYLLRLTDRNRSVVRKIIVR